MDLSKIEIDQKKEKEGIWYPIDDETSLLIGRIGSPRYKKALQELLKHHKKSLRQIRQEKNMDLITRIQQEVLGMAVLLNWKGLKLAGEELVYSEEKAIELMTEDRYQVFRQIVEDLAGDNELFFSEIEEESLGN